MSTSAWRAQVCLIALIMTGLWGPAASAQERGRIGVVKQRLQIVTPPYRLVLEDAAIPLDLPKLSQSLLGRLQVLEPGDRIEYWTDGSGNLTRFVARDREPRPGPDPERDQVVVGRFEKAQAIGGEGSDLWTLTIDGATYSFTRSTLLESVDRDMRFMLIEWETRLRGKKVELVVWRRTVKSIKLYEAPPVSADLVALLRRARRGDVVDVNGQRYSFLSKDERSLTAAPFVQGRPSTEAQRTFPLETIDLETSDFPDARRRLQEGEPGGSERNDPFREVQVGDTVRVKLTFRGQAIEREPNKLVLLPWKNGRWRPEETIEFQASEVLTAPDPCDLESTRTEPLPGGGSLLLITGVKREDGALRVTVTARHDVEGHVLTGLLLAVQAGGKNGHMPDQTPLQVERLEVPELFAGEDRTLSLTLENRELGFAYVEPEPVGKSNLVAVASKAALPVVLRTVARAEGDPDELGQLRRAYDSAARNGANRLLLYLVQRAVDIDDPDSRRRQPPAQAAAKALRGQAAQALEVIHQELASPVRSLRRYRIVEGDLREDRPLDRMLANRYRIRLCELLSSFPGGLAGDSGKRLFDLYLRNDAALQAPIIKAFRSRPDAALQTLLGIAITGAKTNQARAQTATDVLRSLGADVLDALVDELERKGLSRSDAERLRRARSSPTEAPRAVNQALQELVKIEREAQRQRLTDMVAKAQSEREAGRAAEALQLVREVLEIDPVQAQAGDLLPEVLLDRARQLESEGRRGLAGAAYREAIQVLGPSNPASARAKKPLGEILLLAAREEERAVVIRSGPDAAFPQIGSAGAGAAYQGREDENGWVQVDLAEGEQGYIRLKALRQTGPGAYSVVETGQTPHESVLKVLLDEVIALSPSLTSQAGEVTGRIELTEAMKLYELGDYTQALEKFQSAREKVPSDPRLDNETWCWVMANVTLFVALAGLAAIMIAIAAFQSVSRPKKVKFSGEFKHYGAERTRRERNLDLGEEGGIVDDGGV